MCGVYLWSRATAQKNTGAAARGITNPSATHGASYKGYLLAWLGEQAGKQYAKEAMWLKKDNRKQIPTPLQGMDTTDINPLSLLSAAQVEVFKQQPAFTKIELPNSLPHCPQLLPT